MLINWWFEMDMKKQLRTSKKRGLDWWLRGALLLTLILVMATWVAGAAVKLRLRNKYPHPGQLVDVGGHYIQFDQPQLVIDIIREVTAYVQNSSEGTP